MFAKAYKIASQFTYPVVFSARHLDQSIECAVGTYVILNQEGWVVTVAHLLDEFILAQQHEREILKHKQQIAEIENSRLLNENQKKSQKTQLKLNPKWIINTSFWWGIDGSIISEYKILKGADLAIVRLEPYDPTFVTQYPVLKDPKNVPVGTSLCKLGYPFHEVIASFNETTNSFALAPGTLPFPRFPLEGMYTRNIFIGKSENDKYELKFLEMSTPGLLGQSGGPIFDTHGTVWAIQSRTMHIPLGFNPSVEKNGQRIEENQFINVGLGIHPETLIGFLQDNGIKFQISDY